MFITRNGKFTKVASAWLQWQLRAMKNHESLFLHVGSVAHALPEIPSIQVKEQNTRRLAEVSLVKIVLVISGRRQ